MLFRGDQGGVGLSQSSLSDLVSQSVCLFVSQSASEPARENRFALPSGLVQTGHAFECSDLAFFQDPISDLFLLSSEKKWSDAYCLCFH